MTKLNLAQFDNDGIRAVQTLLAECRRQRDEIERLRGALELAMMDHECEGIELNHDTVTAARAALKGAE